MENKSEGQVSRWTDWDEKLKPENKGYPEY